jgi:hypothetical protein
MKDKFIRLTSGWIPVSVLLLFATALVYGGTASDPAANHANGGVRAGFPIAIEVAMSEAPALFELQISPLYE